MKLRPYIISKKAVIDLEEIWFYTVEKWSIEQADRYHPLIFDEIDFICRNADVGSIPPNSGGKLFNLPPDYLYPVNDTVEIIRILQPDKVLNAISLF